MTCPKISIIVPIYNVEDYLPCCIESAINQSLKEIEIILLNDGSTDSSPQIIDRYAEKDARIIPVHKKNEGYGKTCNRGFEMAKGEYVAILESDDFINSDMYEKLYEYAKELDADVVKSPYTDCFSDGVTKPYPHNQYLTQTMPKNTLYSLKECPSQLATHQSIWAGIYRRAYLNENSIRFDEVPGAGHVDIKFCIESLVYSTKLAWLDEPFYNYRVLRENSSTATYSVTENTQRYVEMHEFFRKFPEAFSAAKPELVTREIIGCYRYYKKSDFSAQDFKILMSLFSDFSSKDIVRAPIISNSDKNEVLACIESPEEGLRVLRSTPSPSTQKEPKKKPSRARRWIRKGIREINNSLAFRGLLLLASWILALLAYSSKNFDTLIFLATAIVFVGTCGFALSLVNSIRKRNRR